MTVALISKEGTPAGPVFDYFPYGKQKEEVVTPEKITQTFTGKEFDLFEQDTTSGDDGEGWYYFGARYYDAEIGLWTSTDPKEQFWSPYSYAGNGLNPISAIDPNGEELIYAVYSHQGDFLGYRIHFTSPAEAITKTSVNTIGSIVGIVNPAVGAVTVGADVLSGSAQTGKLSFQQFATLALAGLGFKKFETGGQIILGVTSVGFGTTKDLLENFFLGGSTPYSVIEAFNEKYGLEIFKNFESVEQATALIQSLYGEVGLEFNPNNITVKE